MTTPSTARKAGPYTGTGAQTAWPFSFKVFDASDLRVTIADDQGNESVLAPGADYTVTLNPNQETSPGGTVGYLLPSGYMLAIIGNLPYDQPLDLPSGGNFSPLAIENQLDRATMQIQQLAEQMDRTAKLPPTSTDSVADLVADLQRLADSADNIDTAAINIVAINTVADDLNEPTSEIHTVAGSIGAVNAVGNNIADVLTVANNIADVQAVADIAADVETVANNVEDITNFADVYLGPSAVDPTTRRDGSALQAGDLYFNTMLGEIRVFSGAQWKAGVVGAQVVQRFSGDGTATEFLLDVAPPGEANTQVYIGGVYQQKNTYSVLGNILLFDAAPPAGTENIEVVLSVPYDVLAMTSTARWAYIIGLTPGTYAGQTVFSGLALHPGNVEVYYNGVKMLDGTDFYVDASSVTLVSPVSLGDTLEIIDMRTSVTVIDCGAY